MVLYWLGLINLKTVPVEARIWGGGTKNTKPSEDNAFVNVPAKIEGSVERQLTPPHPPHTLMDPRASGPPTPGSTGHRTKADKPSEMPCKNRGKLIERGFPVLLLPCVEKTYVTKATRLCHTHALHSVQWD